MSGPKSSRYTLTAAQRRILAEQTKLQRERAVLQQYLNQLNECAAFIAAHEHRLANAPVAGLSGTVSEAQAVLVQPVPATEAELQDLNQRTEVQRKAAAKLAADLRAQRRDMEEQVTRSIAADVEKGFVGTLDEALEARATSAETFEARLLTVAEHAICAETARKAREAIGQLQALRTPALLSSFAAITVLPLEQQSRRENEQYAEEAAAWSELLVRYTALCAQLALPEAPQPWHPGAMASLETAVADMEQRVLQQEEQRYIRQALDDVMIEMGYSLLGEREVRKRSGARFHHALYTIGDGTAIDVTYDANGQIAMELGGLDDADRLPDAQEATALCAEMEEFCTSFEDFEARLAGRGVVLRERIAHLPPDENHAQIINVQDYTLTGEPVLYDAGRPAAADRRAVPKRMKKEG